MRKITLPGLYRRFNKKWFNGRLPHAIVQWSDLDRKQCLGLIVEQSDTPVLILLSHRLRPKRLRTILHMVLLHEMVHADTGLKYPDRHLKDHGPEFQSGMLELAKSGAFEKLW